MPENGSFATAAEAGGRAEPPLDWRGRRAALRGARPPWVAPALSAVLVVTTTAVDIVGNLLVILSVLGNRKLRNAGERCARRRVGAPGGRVSGLTLTAQSAARSVLRSPRRLPFSQQVPQVWS